MSELPFYAVPVLGVLGVALLAVWRLDRIVMAMVASGVMIPMIFGKATYVAQSAYAALILLLIFLGLMRVIKGDLRLVRAHLLIGLLGVIILLAYFFPVIEIDLSTLPGSRFPTLLAGLGLLAVTVVAVPKPAQLAKVVALGGAAVGVSAFWLGTYEGGRLSTPEYNANVLAAVCGVAGVIALGLAWHRRKFVWLVPAGASFTVVVATDSRSAMIAVVVGLAILVTNDARAEFKLFLGGAAVLCIAAFTMNTSLFQLLLEGRRSQDALYFSTVERLAIADFAVGILPNHIFRGIGYGSLARYAAVSPEFGHRIGVHNEYLRILVELGLPALGLFLLLLWMALRPSRTGELAVLRAGMAASAVVIAFENWLTHPAYSSYVWVLLGTLLAHREDTLREKSRADRSAAFSLLAEGEHTSQRDPEVNREPGIRELHGRACPRHVGDGDALSVFRAPSRTGGEAVT